MGKQKYTAKEKKVSRMTRNGLVEENLARLQENRKLRGRTKFRKILFIPRKQMRNRKQR